MNPDMVAAYTPSLAEKPFTLGSTYDDGLGIRLGASVGAELKHMEEPFITAPFYPPSALMTGFIVNAQGERFVSEDCYHSRTSQFVMEQPDHTAYLIVDSEHVEYPKFPLVPLIDGFETIARAGDRAGAALRLGGGDARALQRDGRGRRGPRLPQGRRVARAAGHRPVGGLRPAARQGDLRRLHPRRHPGVGRRRGAACGRLRHPGPVRRRRLRVQPRPGRQGLLLRHPAR